MLNLDLFSYTGFAISTCTAWYKRYIPVHQVTGTRTAVIGRYHQKSIVDDRLREKSTVSGRLRNKKGRRRRRRRGKEEKRREERILRRRRLRIARGHFFSRARGRNFDRGLVRLAYEKKTTPRWKYDLGRKKNFEQLKIFVDQVFGADKRYWFIPLYSEEDLRRMPALQGLEYPTKPDLDAQEL
ncbi:hypothetical protein GW17_00036385 [Ensete ventricosum]|nr:hypothetical protein GW17_00036385 [Ensete ventricosum]